MISMFVLFPISLQCSLSFYLMRSLIIKLKAFTKWLISTLYICGHAKKISCTCFLNILMNTYNDCIWDSFFPHFKFLRYGLYPSHAILDFCVSELINEDSYFLSTVGLLIDDIRFDANFFNQLRYSHLM